MCARASAAGSKCPRPREVSSASRSLPATEQSHLDERRQAMELGFVRSGEFGIAAGRDQVTPGGAFRPKVAARFVARERRACRADPDETRAALVSRRRFRNLDLNPSL